MRYWSLYSFIAAFGLLACAAEERPSNRRGEKTPKLERSSSDAKNNGNCPKDAPNDCTVEDAAAEKAQGNTPPSMQDETENNTGPGQPSISDKSTENPSREPNENGETSNNDLDNDNDDDPEDKEKPNTGVDQQTKDPEEKTDPVSQLDPSVSPGKNFDLGSWYITMPDGSTRSTEWLTSGGAESDLFYTDKTTGGMVFRTPNIGGSTANSKYSRTELREMLRRDNTKISTRGLNKNNWVFASSADEAKGKAGGVDGLLKATLKIDRVSVTGSSSKVGRAIFGQIHASENEPIRLYYRKLPNNINGSIYFAHEPNKGDEVFVEMIGSKSSSAEDPKDGIPLGETFSYSIKVEGHSLIVTITRQGRKDAVAVHDMSKSGFEDDWMYFKAGIYNQNNTGEKSDYAQATFFSLTNTHD